MTNPLKQLKYLKWWELVLILAMIVIIGTLMFRAEAFNNNWDEPFDSYATGELDNNAKWASTTNASFLVSTDASVIKAGTKGAYTSFSGGVDASGLYFYPNDTISSGVSTYTFSFKEIFYQSWPNPKTFIRFFAGDTGQHIDISIQGDRFTADKFDIFGGGYFYTDTDDYDDDFYSTLTLLRGGTGGQLSKNAWIDFTLTADYDTNIVQVDATDGVHTWQDFLWFNGGRTTTTTDHFKIDGAYHITAFDEFQADAEPVLPSLDITSPADDSILSEAFDIIGTYSNATSTWKTMIIFEDWDASSTCPVYGTEQYETERWLYFNYQSLPYFSSAFATSTGTTTIAVSDLPAGNYRCIRCYFINESTGQISDEVCTGYNLVVNVSIPFEEMPEYTYPFADWSAYYSSSTDKWATSTALFSSLANAVAPLINWVGNLSVSFHSILSTTTASAYGTQFGNAIPILRGYLVVVNNFFGGLPVAEIFLFYIIVAVLVLIYKLIHSFITLIKP